MKDIVPAISRRNLLKTAGAGAALLFAPAVLRSQELGAIRIGGLMPLSGAGGVWGPIMANIQRHVVDEVNAAGGILGQKVEYFVEDDQTNPDAGVLAVRKLIDVNKVCAVTGVWSSGVAMPTLPICWENKVAMLGIAASDTLADLPHQGYFIRTYVPVSLQGREIGKFGLSKGTKNFFLMLAQNPFSQAMLKGLTDEVEPHGAKVSHVIYDGTKTSFRSEVDQALGAKPDFIMLGGYPQDSASIMKDLYRNSYDGTVCGFGTAITTQFVQAAGKGVAEGVYTVLPSVAEDSSAYQSLKKIAGNQTLDTNACQAYDQINLILLAIAASKQATGQAIQETIRSTIGGPEGEAVGNVADGLAHLAAGKKINYDGASSNCEFLPNGNLPNAYFKTLQVKDGVSVPV
ncbi:ABC transporter substrate-binding protein [Mesorhizobium sp. B2-6-1]|uniref:ABC transporter substrate-binding protein n=1 Tax=Mesorhizobium sp. B2-6-1 TaxID=2589916 RepID=UPI001129839C|nr:ABC transporter substrate-binding protein [Mesorhizobium sp. B2-6-1]TPJ57615.1 amino acid ABC transporter substrate-binding protein [Mesorhizobium sp. B2-6-1]